MRCALLFGHRGPRFIVSSKYGGPDDQSYGAEEKMRDHRLVPVFRIGIRGMALFTIFSIGLPPGPITSQETCEDTFLDSDHLTCPGKSL